MKKLHCTKRRMLLLILLCSFMGCAGIKWKTNFENSGSNYCVSICADIDSLKLSKMTVKQIQESMKGQSSKPVLDSIRKALEGMK
jgi:hypothetical protein